MSHIALKKRWLCREHRKTLDLGGEAQGNDYDE